MVLCVHSKCIDDKVWLGVKPYCNSCSSADGGVAGCMLSINAHPSHKP